ncbi:rRNA maturation RNase YbeY [Metamycoplasma hyosynoviae]|uniref:rRNA maturation RNase YbeY n=1 Tax=Metamycoplasma hyosynoviae TaxID=29559 RepID=UPI0023594B2E|nr:rRNA maturation RNase YbeY [Metamycoplasma hyosynoviae]MDC8921234.1 rRNA maturation RNase YbeY [Metamycoplasma hyosynoviae]MDC8921482.1 rRNA maturation RNase YbeY [Metamycoplasma hyosynoviae]MDD1378455.1 rRNA maturation RNase YbeY [Metamycoplasma hyosynoviae]
MNNKLNFLNKSFSKFIFIKEFEEILEKTIQEFNLTKNISVDVLFVDRFKMKKLNKMYRNKNYTTDILSFPIEADMNLDFLEVRPLGQIIISPWKIKKQAKEFNHSLKREFCYIFAHGIVHLLGFDHQTPEEEKVMNQHVDNIMNMMSITRY